MVAFGTQMHMMLLLVTCILAPPPSLLEAMLAPSLLVGGW